MIDLRLAVCWPAGARVRFAGSGDVEGQVTGYFVEPDLRVKYEVTWLHNGERRAALVHACEIESVEPEPAHA